MKVKMRVYNKEIIVDIDVKEAFHKGGFDEGASHKAEDIVDKIKNELEKRLPKNYEVVYVDSSGLMYLKVYKDEDICLEDCVLKRALSQIDKLTIFVV